MIVWTVCVQVVNRHEPVVVPLDLNDIDSISTVVRDIEFKYGPIDIVLNNAGISSRGSAVETSIQVDKQVMAVNYFGQIAMIKGMYTYMYSYLLYVANV